MNIQTAIAIAAIWITCGLVAPEALGLALPATVIILMLS